MIMSENFNKHLEQKRGGGGGGGFPQIKKIRYRFFVKIHLLENSKSCRVCAKKLLIHFEMLIVPYALMHYIV